MSAVTERVVSELVLASASPRRLALLRQVRVPVVAVPADIDETRAPGEAAVPYALRMASEKAHAGLVRVAHALPERRGAWVIAADTIEVVDGETLGKPRDDHEARAHIRLLAGRAHEVITAVAIGRDGGPFEVGAQHTVVHFRALRDAEVDAYVATGEGHDKAGSYGIQGIGAGLVQRVEGCYFNVVGLPLSHTLGRLVALGALPSWP